MQDVIFRRDNIQIMNIDMSQTRTISDGTERKTVTIDQERSYRKVKLTLSMHEYVRQDPLIKSGIAELWDLSALGFGLCNVESIEGQWTDLCVKVTFSENGGRLVGFGRLPTVGRVLFDPLDEAMREASETTKCHPIS